MSSERYFDEVAERWDVLQASFFSDAVRDRAIAAAGVKAGTLAADIGAGTGFIAQGLIKAAVRVIAVDQSQAMLDELQKKFADSPLVETRLGSGDAIPIPDRTVDYAFANMYLHHVDHPQQAIKEMARILMPGGTLVITDMDEHDAEFLRAEHHDRWLGFRRSDLHTWLERAGLECVSVVSTNERCASSSSAGSATATIGIFLASGKKPAG
ncbi:MAG TPA: methyltransferase domain-containing protein [Candidatus Acidoferrum sp.]|nr:methyltransferase domain-containing protein [Candidatus Acidoferrum sp.]